MIQSSKVQIPGLFPGGGGGGGVLRFRVDPRINWKLMSSVPGSM